MKTTTRRAFIKSSVATASVVALPAIAQSKSGSSDRIRVGVIGMHRGLAHARSIAEMEKSGQNVEVAVSCDCDLRAANWAADIIEKQGVKRPLVVQDLRRLMEDKSIDAVSIGTPDHWHAPAAIWACQAGKDVFVEKPLAHTIEEGRKMVEAARKYKRMVQVGTQCRSSPNIIEGVKHAREGLIGDIYMARAVSFKVHGNLGRHKPTQPPKELDWDIFVGPAPKQPYSNFRKTRWYWLRDFCNGDMANQPTHQLDIIRWAMKLEEHPVQAQSMGGCLVHDDDREWPDNQTFTCKFADGRMISVEHRNWWTAAEGGLRDKWPFSSNPDAVVGAILLGKKGFMVFPSYTSYYSFLGPKREPGPHADSPTKIPNWHAMDNVHHPNWIKACRSRNLKYLNADVEQGHMATTIALLGSISLLTEQTVNFDPKTETFPGNPAANKLLSKDYREPFVVPKEV
ncbi:MAG: Gfo/Idh/MocA family oxidoreductase [Pirellulales bacterium]|nr:Gfo/Idh/MocA family oxidoreductase [Pirellulales bacterium]